MRAVFIGSVRFSQHCLRELLRAQAGIVAVLSPAAEDARFNADYADLAPLAAEHDIPLHRIRKINDAENIALLRRLEPDVIFVLGFSQLISAEILAIPRLGCIGNHPTLLPLHRGRHPLIWALVEGLTESGLTFFFMDEGADSGDILWQRPFPITLEDDAASLYRKCEELAMLAIPEFVPQLASGHPPRRPQDHSRATYWRKRGRADGEIHWEGPAMVAYNLIRALTHPYIGAHTFQDGKELIIWKARLIPGGNNNSAPPGTVVEVADGLAVQARDGLLQIVDWTSQQGAVLRPGVVLTGDPATRKGS